jgi:hypothetical protein
MDIYAGIYSEYINRKGRETERGEGRGRTEGGKVL